MTKEIIVISDIEMGAGNLTDDFISDIALHDFIVSLTQKKHPVDLVLNGDTFDFMKCPLMVGDKETYPRHICQNVSIAKLNLIYKAHKMVFEALRHFVSSEKNRLFFIIGNHDHDLVFPGVCEAIKGLLKGHKENIFFPGFHYEENRIYAEHGQQYDFLYKMRPDRLTGAFQGKEILNLPFVTAGLITRFMNYKKEYAFYDRIRPRPLYHNKPLTKQTFRMAWNYFLHSLIFYPVRRYKDPTYNFPGKFLYDTVRRLLKNKGNVGKSWDLDPITDTYAKKRKDLLKKNAVSVLGHGHENIVKKMDDHVIFQTGCWRDEYYMDPETKKIIPNAKGYVSIEVLNNTLNHKLVAHPVKRNILDYDVSDIKDDTKYVRLAAQEENYCPLYWD